MVRVFDGVAHDAHAAAVIEFEPVISRAEQMREILLAAKGRAETGELIVLTTY
jgi:hypothetical protein